MASQRVLTGTTRSALSRSAQTSLALRGSTSTTFSRALHSRPSRPTTISRPSWVTYGGASLALSLPFSLFSKGGKEGNDEAAAAAAAKGNSSGSSDNAESQSSAILRQASPAAMRSQPTTLMFLSVKGSQRYDWQEWIGYFREAGYDILDCNLAAATSSADEAKVLGDELASQVRLSSLQRQPLVFIRASASPLALPLLGEHLASKRPSVAGIVIVTSSEGAGPEAVDALAKKLGGRVKVVKDDEEGLRDSERWLTEQGF